jgi:16S rRNA (guanine527-N7)-methyltransferase
VSSLDDLTTSFGFAAGQAEALARYLDLLLGWRRGNVTAVRTRDEAVDLLLGDSLALLDLPALEAAGPRWLDLGAGAGIPGIPLAVARPEVELTLLDSVARKCAFLEAAVAEAGLVGRARVVCARSETFAAAVPADDHRGVAAASREAARGGGRDAFDIVFARAVASLPAVVELAAPLLATGGALVAVKTGEGGERERSAGDEAAARCGLSAGAVAILPRSPLRDPAGVVYTKTAATPAWLPRRPGMAVKRPLAP